MSKPDKRSRGPLVFLSDSMEQDQAEDDSMSVFRKIVVATLVACAAIIVLARIVGWWIKD